MPRVSVDGVDDVKEVIDLTPEELRPGAPAVRDERMPEQCIEALRAELECRISILAALRDDHTAEIEYRRARLAETESALKMLQAAQLVMEGQGDGAGGTKERQP